MSDKKPELSYGAQIRRNLIGVVIGAVILFAAYLIFTNIGGKDTEAAVTAPSAAPTQKSVIALDPTAKPTIEPAVLGGNGESFENEFGKPNRDDGMTWNYDNDRVQCFGYDHICINLRLQFEEPVQFDTALKDALKMSPKDAIETNRREALDEEAELKITYVEYMSESLKSEFEADQFTKGEPGSFLMIIKESKDGVFTVVMGLGNNP